MTIRIATGALALLLAALAAAPASAREPRTAADVLRDIDGMQYTRIDPDRLDDPAYVAAYGATDKAYIEKRTRLIAELLRLDSKNERLPELLLERWWDMDRALADPELERKLVADQPEAVARARASRRLREAIGKPFKLEFTDAISGKTIRTTDLKGKVVVIDFWGTWCGGCNAALPELKQLYADYKDRGLELIGVAFNAADDPDDGLAELKRFVAKRQVPWPQFFQPEGFESEIVSSWGINAIPRFFVVDVDGNLVSTTAHGKLKEMLPDLLAKANAGAKGGG